MTTSVIISSVSTRACCASEASEDRVFDTGVLWSDPDGIYPRDMINIQPVFSRVVFKGLALL